MKEIDLVCIRNSFSD